MRGVTGAILIRGQVVGDEPLQRKPIGELRGEHRIVKGFVTDEFHVFAGRHLVFVLVITRNAPANHDAL